MSQAEFDTIVEELKLSGVHELPEGVSELTKRELRFLSGLVAHGQQAKAALDAGYGGNLNSAGVHASKLIRKPKIQRVYRLALDQLAKDANQLVKRVCERSVMLHAQFREASQRKSELKELLLLSEKEEAGGEEGVKVTREYETELTRIVRLEKHYAGLANQTDQLLASLLGKLNVNVSGTIQHEHDHRGDVLVIPANNLETFGRIRQESVGAATPGGRN